MKAVMDQYMCSLRPFHQICLLPHWDWLETERNDCLIPTEVGKFKKSPEISLASQDP